MMSCLEVTRVAGDFLERRLRLRQRMSVLMHIAMCRGCRAYIEQLRLTLLGLRSLPAPAGPTDHRDDLVERFRKRKGHP
jgi:hypothetical protein